MGGIGKIFAGWGDPQSPPEKNPEEYHWGYYEGTLQLLYAQLASHPFVTVASEYPHSTLNSTATHSSPRGSA